MLDECLLQDDEMDQGPRYWQEKWLSEDKIQLPTILYQPKYMETLYVENQDNFDLNQNLIMDDILDEVEAIQITTIKPQKATEFVYNP